MVTRKEMLRIEQKVDEEMTPEAWAVILADDLASCATI